MANYSAGATGNNPPPLPSISNITPLLDAEKIKANLLISAANVILLQSCHDAGELDIPENALLYIIPSSSTDTTSDLSSSSLQPVTPPPKPSAIQIFAALSTISPNSFKNIYDTIDSTISSSSNTNSIKPKLLFLVKKETPLSSSSSSNNWSPHPFIITLALYGFHIPLSLFTSKSTQTLFNMEASIPQKHVNMKNNQKRYIIDINHFLKESEMDSSNWFKAWVHYRMFLEQHADVATLL